MKTLSCTKLFIVATVFLTLGSIGFGQASAPAPDTAGIVQLDRNYENAFGKGDATALSAMFAEDVEYTDSDGVLRQSRPAIESLLRKYFTENPGAKMTINMQSIKVLASDVAVERGTTVTMTRDKEQTTSAYTAIFTRKNGKWLIQQLVESPVPAPSPNERLSELAWLVGTWKEQDGEMQIETKTQWARGGNFLTRTFKVTSSSEVTLEGWQVIGWNPVESHIHSWLFDSGGAVMEGTWTRAGNSWLIRQVGFLADGGQLSSDSTLQRVDDNKCYFESTNRTLDGDPQPNLPRIEIVRAK